MQSFLRPGRAAPLPPATAPATAKPVTAPAPPVAAPAARPPVAAPIVRPPVAAPVDLLGFDADWPSTAAPPANNSAQSAPSAVDPFAVFEALSLGAPAAEESKDGWNWEEAVASPVAGAGPPLAGSAPASLQTGGGAVQGSTAASGSPAGSSTTGRVSHASNPSHDAILSLFDVSPISSSASAPVIAQGADAPAPNAVPGLIPQHSRKAASFSLGAKSPRPPSEAAFDSLLQL